MFIYKWAYFYFFHYFELIASYQTFDDLFWNFPANISLFYWLISHVNLIKTKKKHN